MEESEQRTLDTSLNKVRQQAFYMKRAIDCNDMKDSIKFASEMLEVLRTNRLSPKSYYELYIKVSDEMRELEDFFSSLQRDGMKMIDLYEQVQSCSMVVPRLYLMCCVGGVYISSQETPARDILRDMVEMLKGVQHPMRGLFLRNYLTQVSKNRLPDVGSPYEGEGGNTADACDFLLNNFSETNKLWIRLSTQQRTKADRKKRELQRQDLKILVGTNLVRLSQLEGLDITVYQKNVLPRLLQEVDSCKDTLAQGYLMDCIIQVFPDEFHVATLEPFLKLCTQLKEKVDVRSILDSMMKRLSNQASALSQQDTNAFKLFNECITSLIMDRANMNLTESLKLQTALMNFALECYAGRLDYVGHCLKTCCSLIEKPENSNQSDVDDSRSSEITIQIETLLSTPLSQLSLKVMDLPQYAKLMALLPWENWREVASNFLRAVIKANEPLYEMDKVQQLFSMITPLLEDEEGKSSTGDDEEENSVIKDDTLSPEFKMEQQLVARVVHLLKSDDTDIQLEMYKTAKVHFTSGGKSRMRFTLTPLVFGALNLTRRVFNRELAHSNKSAEETEAGSAPQFSTRKVLHFIIEIVTGMATSFSEVALKLFLSSAQVADEYGFPAISYEFMKEALLVYESEITDSKAQVRVLHSIIGSLLKCRNFPVEDYETLITKVAQFSNKLLKKPDQCKMIAICSHLFWPKGSQVEGNNDKDNSKFYCDNDRVQECLERALKIASKSDPMLFVDILDHYIYYFENGDGVIEAKFISGVISLINEQFVSSTPGQTNPAAVKHYKNTLAYIRQRQGTDSPFSEKFLKIQVKP
jgi:vacuolar protein sorting-associated protein 35